MYDTLTAKLKNIHAYHTTCPVTITKQKLVRKMPDNHACKKKNLLYRQFLKNRSVASEEGYKIYKNILRYCGKKHFTELLEKTKETLKKLGKL